MHVCITFDAISMAIDITMKPVPMDHQVIKFLVHVIKTLLWLIGFDSIIATGWAFQHILSGDAIAIFTEICWWTRLCGILCEQSMVMVMGLIPAVDFNGKNEFWAH